MAGPADLLNAAFTALGQGRFSEADRDLRKLLRRDPRNVAALNLLGAALMAQRRYAEAEPHLVAALRAKVSAATLYNYGLALKGLHRPDEALQRFSEALALEPANAETLNNRGTVLNDLGDYAAAVADFDSALALAPRYAAAYVNRSKALTGLRRYAEALAANDAALALRPDMPEAWFGRGYIYAQMRQPVEAAAAYRRARELDPGLPVLTGSLLHQKMLACDWDGIDALIAEVEADLAAGRLAAEPFGWQGIACTEASLQRCARLTHAARHPERAQARLAIAPAGARIRIGYLSGEFREQATSLLLAGVLEQHDRSAFEIVAIDNSHDDGSVMRRRILSAVDDHIDITALNDPQAVDAIRRAGIDVLVNLNGYFGAHRNGVFARRAAPLQVNYLGFPGTLGSPCMDYILADEVVIPEAHRRFYDEKVAWLPCCYQANDDRREIASKEVSREECGLPARGVVFCCFNNAYKITPDIFTSWMRILAAVPGSVLWLLQDNIAATGHLRREAAARGIDPTRLIFAERQPPAAHLARHRCADLFLDTLPYNAHTTASDALWAGLPLLTRRGDTFAGRVASSLLQHLDLPQLIADTQDDYEARAIALANDPARLGEVRAMLQRRRGSGIFETKTITRHIETAFATMVERCRHGLSPAHFAVQNSAS